WAVEGTAIRSTMAVLPRMH
ncbi:hypothetical protein A2U01_0112697, partial [Trifolium medium]|nr:hypothetical protein [Trifolium medium]